MPEGPPSTNASSLGEETRQAENSADKKATFNNETPNNGTSGCKEEVVRADRVRTGVLIAESQVGNIACECFDWMRSACGNNGYYGEHEGKRYCVLHYPGEEKKAEFEEALRGKLGDLNFQGVWFPDVAVFAGRIFAVNVDFRGADFSAGANFSAAVFIAAADFSNAHFRGPVRFKGASFLGDAGFEHTRFYDEVTFDSASFSAAACFSDALFKESVTAVNFNDASFGPNSSFDKAIFDSRLSFNPAVFNGKVSFEQCILKKSADFRQAQFLGAVNFYEAQFHGRVDFSEVLFSQELDFRSARCHAESIFSKVQFKERSFFNYARFEWKKETKVGQEIRNREKRAYFGDAEFYGDADFRFALFDNGAIFSRAFFGSYVRFQRHANNRTFGSNPELTFEEARIADPRKVFFQTVALRPYWFILVDPREFSLIDVTWDWKSIRVSEEIRKTREELKAIEPSPESSILLDSRGQSAELMASGLPSPVRTDQELGSLGEHRTERIAVFASHEVTCRVLSVAFRRLAENAESNNLHEDASWLRYGAMKVSWETAWRGAAFGNKNWLHLFYRLASGYGERVLIALGWLLAIWLGFAISYNYVGFNSPSARPSAVTMQEEDTIGHPLGFMRSLSYSLEVMALQRPEPRPTTTCAHTLLVTETVLGPVQAALFALAVRRKFMK